MTQHIDEAQLALPDEWFFLTPSDDDLAAWAADTAYAAWQVRVAAGAEEEQVLPRAGERLATALYGTALSLEDVVADGVQAAVWVPKPEVGALSAVLLMQIVERTTGRSPGSYAAAVAEMTASATDLDDVLSVQEVVGTVRAGAAEGVHTITSVFQPERGVGAVEERTSWIVFPDGSTEAVEVVVIAENTGVFEDMPGETLAILEGLTVRSGGAVTGLASVGA